MSITGIIAGAKTAAKLIPYAGMTAALVFGGIQWANAGHWKKRYTAEAASHVKTKTDTRLAQAQAEIKARDAVDAERLRYENLTMKVIQSHEIYSDANSRAVADLLRSEATRRVASKANLPASTQMPGGPVQAATEALISSVDLYAIGGAYAQCDTLIEWARGVGGEK